MSRIPTVVLLLLGLLASIATSSSAPTFCKCTCFSNYTIIPLGPQHDADNPQGQQPSHLDPPPDFLKQTRSPLDDQNDGLVDLSRNGRRPPGTATSGVGARVANTPDDNNYVRCPTNPEERKSQNRRSAAEPASWFPSLLERTLMREKRASSSSCAQCNRAFCLGYNLPICKDAEEKDVQTMCFQRDSRKDQIIIWGFILGTAGLLGWAGVRRLLESRKGLVRRREEELDRGAYRPVGEGGQI